MKHILIITVSLTILTFTLTQCSKNQGNPVGAQFFQRESWGSENCIFQQAASDTFYYTSVNTGSSSSLYLGQYQGSESRILVLFSNLPDSGTVDSALVTLYTQRTIGSATHPATASVHAINRAWEESEITWESFGEGSIGEQIATMEISDEQPAADNDTTAIIFYLPPSRIQSWMDSSQASENFGILLASFPPDTGYFIEFFSRESTSDEFKGPRMTIYITQDTTHETYNVYPTQDTFIANTRREPTSDRLFIANGIALRSMLSFNVDSIPDNATINRALLTLYSDTLLSFPDHRESFDVIVYPVTDGSWPIPAVPFDSTMGIAGSVIEDSSVMNLTPFVQGWTAGFTTNYGLLLIGWNERNDLHRRAFYSIATDSHRQPKLKIFYTLPPSSRL
jgi:hypothetical protein